MNIHLYLVYLPLVLNNDMLRACEQKSKITLSKLRRFLISLRLPSEKFKGWRLQILGVMIGSNLNYHLPALIRVQVGESPDVSL